MLGIGYLLLFAVYFFIARFIVRATIKWAKNRNKSVRLWGGLIGLLMLSLIFWDVIPIYGTHYYQCAVEGGFTVHKTLDEWKKENPNIAETLVSVDGRSTIEGETTLYQLNQRFVWDITNSQLWYTLYKKHEEIIDVKTGDILAEYTDFYTNLKNPMVTPTTKLRDFKLWMKISSCEKSGHKVSGKKFNQFEAIIENLGRK